MDTKIKVALIGAFSAAVVAAIAIIPQLRKPPEPPPARPSPVPSPTVIEAKWSLSMSLPSGWSGYSFNMPPLPKGWFGEQCPCASPNVLPYPSTPFQNGSVVELPNRCAAPIEVAIGKLEPSSAGALQSVSRTVVPPGSVLKADVSGAIGFAVLLKKCPQSP